MPLELVTVPCLKDNYAFLIHDPGSRATAVVDVPEAAPIRAALKARNWTLTHVLLTHHHWDHIDGVADLIDGTEAKVIGAAADAHRLPPLDLALTEGDSFWVGGAEGQVIDVPGHTVGHIAFYFPQSALVFTGDSLMAMGCGRLFEGTPDQMWQSLCKLAALPPETQVCSGHEYTTSNARFAQSLEEMTPALILRLDAIARARDAGLPTVPSLLGEELATNPFLRAGTPALKAAIGMADAQDAAVFAELRARKDNF
ncbi:hydroxyacylglutathione hydrolase [Gemmobacter fulvus]|uniref:Hydroxyacylglutathione hydrolase n=1 Tax=Gemmobacter fulvus TaxID=2840474 RepID=A0A975P5Z7_9RHOB|nr:hydroxyacylglutathione hydrolase [Gemmobacter fulvus]MBT9247517.1 hydroxyacylglutathione hydrolase [Gemmobacter fulvus]MDQ1847636.1 hydroxyacylglutathione hydrolase [Gemmobacter fulvus]QWK89972.1 hydroxyacylglutathione hydrolase [Gemmobacter fulvus]